MDYIEISEAKAEGEIGEDGRREMMVVFVGKDEVVWKKDSLFVSFRGFGHGGL